MDKKEISKETLMKMMESTQANAVSLCEKYEAKRRTLAVVEERKVHLLKQELDLALMINLLEKVMIAFPNNDDEVRDEVIFKLVELKQTLEDVKGELTVLKIVHGV